MSFFFQIKLKPSIPVGCYCKTRKCDSINITSLQKLEVNQLDSENPWIEVGQHMFSHSITIINLTTAKCMRFLSVFDHHISLRVLSKQHLLFLLLQKRFESTSSLHPGIEVMFIFNWTSFLQTSVCYHPEAFRVLCE